MADSKVTAGTGVALGFAFVGRPVAPEWALSIAQQNYPTNLSKMLCATKGMPIDKARETIVEKALDRKCKYVWFVDDDTAPPFFATRSLIETLENSDPRTMVAGGIYCAKAHPTDPIVYRENGVGSFWKWKQGDIFECASIGTGCMMIKTELFKHLERPWFKTIDGEGTSEQPINFATDDIYFCDKVIKAGFKIMADSRVLCIHWGWDADQQDFVPFTLPEDCYPLRPVTEAEPRCKREMQEEVAVA
jgi:hypothetical protein